jgi:hypothetical protein
MNKKKIERRTGKIFKFLELEENIVKEVEKIMLRKIYMYLS